MCGEAGDVGVGVAVDVGEGAEVDDGWECRRMLAHAGADFAHDGGDDIKEFIGTYLGRWMGNGCPWKSFHNLSIITS